MRIALCDDESGQLAQIGALLADYEKLHPQLAIRTAPFSCGAALLEQVRVGGGFDLYLLDVLMPGENGIQVGAKLRELDRGGMIFYLTASPGLCGRLLSRQGVPIPAQAAGARIPSLPRWTRRRRAGRAQKQTFVTVKTRDGLQRLPARSIVYGELVGQRIQYHLADGSVIEGMSLRRSFRDAVAPLLEQECFVLCSASFFVNLFFVERIERDGARLAGGGMVPLTRPLRSQVTDRWLDYHLKGGGAL